MKYRRRSILVALGRLVGVANRYRGKTLTSKRARRARSRAPPRSTPAAAARYKPLTNKPLTRNPLTH
jgi:hypothetical protein